MRGRDGAVGGDEERHHVSEDELEGIDISTSQENVIVPDEIEDRADQAGDEAGPHDDRPVDTERPLDVMEIHHGFVVHGPPAILRQYGCVRQITRFVAVRKMKASPHGNVISGRRSRRVGWQKGAAT